MIEMVGKYKIIDSFIKKAIKKLKMRKINFYKPIEIQTKIEEAEELLDSAKAVL